MHKRSVAVFCFVSASFLLSSCGGGGSGGSGGPGNSVGTVPTYSFVAPVVGAQSLYAETIVDNLNNTLNRSLVYDVTAVNADGSFTHTESDPSNDSITSGSVTYTIYPATQNYNSVGQLTSTTVTPPGSSTTCLYSPHAGGAPSPLSVGQTWSFAFTTNCTSMAGSTSQPSMVLAESQSGALVDMESITVPAGTFNAYKLQSTTTWTTAAGTTVTETTTNWRDASGYTRSLKEVSTFIYSGAAPAQGSTVTEMQVLQSYH
ncbi:MAG: hypothetical protein JO269_03390 [Burkholderiaceae bacterium]|nr:hypothetical protein [Burkholderiaceae bacterium]